MTNPKQPADPPPTTLPTPEDPREPEPMRDPPLDPEHDDVGVGEIRQARDHGIEAPNPSPDAIVYDRPSTG